MSGSSYYHRHGDVIFITMDYCVGAVEFTGERVQRTTRGTCTRTIIRVAFILSILTTALKTTKKKAFVGVLLILLRDGPQIGNGPGRKHQTSRVSGAATSQRTFVSFIPSRHWIPVRVDGVIEFVLGVSTTTLPCLLVEQD